MSKGSDFWSRRKAGVEAEAETLAREEDLPVEDERSDDEILADLQLAEPESLETSEAVKDFLKHDLPQRLKARGLRQLWRTNPVLANVDGLVDYGEDFTDAAMVVDKMETVYQVGKGMLTAFLEDETDDEDIDVTEEVVEECEAPLIAAAEPQALPEPEPAPIAAPQRRMRFAFEEDG